MKRKDFFLSATAGLLTLNQVSADNHRPGRGEGRGGRGGRVAAPPLRHGRAAGVGVRDGPVGSQGLVEVR